MLDEDQGCAVLTRVFNARGYQVERDVPFEEGTVAFTADGWDAASRVGFEYLTHAAGDHRDLTPDEIETLAARMEQGELFLFIIDERQVDTADDLEWAAQRFLDEVQRRRDAAAQASS
ncbi:MAG: hypothetical protein K0V04_46605 [Deltaproteobacteria bacterium]|nr:hypothetical protein [Deltaproteobacteria bacterium]